MATQYTLRFSRFRLIDYDGMTDVIRSMDYGITANAGNIEVYVDGTVTLDYPKLETFIPKEDVTMANAHAWFALLEDEEEGGNLLALLKSKLDEMIARRQAPTVRVERTKMPFRRGKKV